MSTINEAPSGGPVVVTPPPAASTSTCIVLPQGYCGSGKLVGYPAGGMHTANATHAAFNLPPGADVYLPFDVDHYSNPNGYTDIGGQKYPITGIVSKDGRYYVSIVGKLDNVMFSKNKGDYLGKVTSDQISTAGNYNFIITFFDVNPPKNENDIHDLNLTRQYFPNL